MERKSSAKTQGAREEQARAANGANGQVGVMSVEQIRGLVRLLDRSDVAELEVKSSVDDVHLVLRKIKGVEGIAVDGAQVAELSESSAVEVTEAGANKHTVTAPLVGVFHPWLKPRGGTLAAVGDHVKIGQLIGTIESLNVFNEVETSVAGRVVEIHVQDGQPIEYGQALLTIEIAEAEER